MFFVPEPIWKPLKTLQKQIKPVDIVLSKMILDIPVPVISAMEGHAIGGGLALGLCADIAILAEESVTAALL